MMFDTSTPLTIPAIQLPQTAFRTSDFSSLGQVFRECIPLELGQFWLKSVEADFTPATARVGWGQMPLTGEIHLWVWADLTDEAPTNAATRPNQRTWELGDVFEIFLAAQGDGPYYEMHVTPENQTLQLNIVSREKPFEEWIMGDGPSWSAAWLKPDGWQVLAALPLSLIDGQQSGLLSLSRYDYQPGRAKPVISSSSPHEAPNFHRRFEWTPFVLAS